MSKAPIVLLKCDVCLQEFRRESEARPSFPDAFAIPDLGLNIVRDCWVAEELGPLRFDCCCDDCWVVIRKVVVQIIGKLKTEPPPKSNPARLEGERCV